MNVARIDDRDWTSLTLGDQIYQIEVEGYLVMPALLSAHRVRQLKSETAPPGDLPHALQRAPAGPAAPAGNQPVSGLQLGTLPGSAAREGLSQT